MSNGVRAYTPSLHLWNALGGASRVSSNDVMHAESRERCGTTIQENPLIVLPPRDQSPQFRSC